MCKTHTKLYLQRWGGKGGSLQRVDLLFHCELKHLLFKFLPQHPEKTKPAIQSASILIFLGFPNAYGDQIHYCCASSPFMWGFPSKLIFVLQVKQSAGTGTSRDTGINQWEWEGKSPAGQSTHAPGVTPDVQAPSTNLSLMVHSTWTTAGAASPPRGVLCAHLQITPDPAAWESPAHVQQLREKGATFQLLFDKNQGTVEHFTSAGSQCCKETQLSLQWGL